MSEFMLPYINHSRLRMGIDGFGITTLVGCYGCNLRCKQCLNPHAFSTTTKYSMITCEELYEKVKIDHLYFLATGGGLTFGGGESLLHADFIKEFAAIYQIGWKLGVETSLNVPWENVEKITNCVGEYIIDIKDTDSSIYRAYTGQDNFVVLENLKKLIEVVPTEKIVIRVPLIPDYNTEQNRTSSVEHLKQLGYTRFDLFTYQNVKECRKKLLTQ